ncbi:MAG: ATP-binding cassette domain-containing protein [Spirochaetaceae bacterium]|nr:MAG: ATP-binding cassette domain-containing protein [Spirochaetaceae bacterium]
MFKEGILTPLLEIKNLTKGFTLHHQGISIRACEMIDLTLQQGEFVGITGRSGSGKSTILKLIYRSYLPQSGDILYNSKSFGMINLCSADEQEILHLRRYEIGYVSQFLKVIPRTTARQIVEKAALDAGIGRDSARQQAEDLLQHFELDPELWDTFPNTFSGGERLRLGIAKAMISQPRLLLLDEPTASLDAHSKLLVRQLIERLKNQGTTMLGIFHDLEFMDGLCDREYPMHMGKIEQAYVG